MNPIWAGLLGLAALTTTAGCDGKVTRQVQAKVLESHGHIVVEFQDGTPQGPASVAPGFQIPIGAKVRTADDAALSLMLLPGALLHLGANCEFLIQELKLGKNGYSTAEAMSRTVRVLLSKGTAYIVVQFESDAAPVIVETASGTFSMAYPATCRLEAQPDRTRVTAVRGGGTYSLKGSVKTQAIDAGHIWESDPADTAAIPVETQERAQAEVDECLDVERKLLNLQRAERFSPFPWRRL